MDRLVQRFPSLSLFYKPSADASADAQEIDDEQEYCEDGDEAPQLVDAYPTDRELTSDELALHGRYSNKLRTQIIRLQAKDQTQPVDVCVHHDTYTVYVCDVGRSVVELFGMNGKLKHIIDDPTTVKFQPTAIAIADDGTVIVASHFNHRLHMYLPESKEETAPANDNESVAAAKHQYIYQQFKLGSPGKGVHEFYHPAGIAIDPRDGYLYVCDRGNARIQVLRPEGICERVITLLVHDGEGEHRISSIRLAHQHKGDQMVCMVGGGDALCFLSRYADG